MRIPMKRLFVIGLAMMASFVLDPAPAEPVPTEVVSLVPFDLDSKEKVVENLGPPGSLDNPHRLIQLIREPKFIKPGTHVSVPLASGDEVMLLPLNDGETEYSDDKKWDYTKDLLLMAKWDIPTELQTRDIEVKSIKVVGVASTYGRNDGFAGQLTSSGKLVNSNTAALQMDLAHVLSDFGAVPFSMRGVKATLTMPDGRQITKNLEDKGGLVNYLGESYWRGALKNMKVDKNGVGVLAPLPASHYRVVDIFTQSQSTLIPNVAVEIHLKKPLLRKVDLTSKQRQAWMRSNFQEPGTSE